MEIYSFTHEQEVPGTVRFDYRGYTISLSTMPQVQWVNELMIAKTGTNDWKHRDTWTDDVGCVCAIVKAKAIIDELHSAQQVLKDWEQAN